MDGRREHPQALRTPVRPAVDTPTRTRQIGRDHRSHSCRDCSMKITKAGLQPSRIGSRETFTGRVRVELAFETEEPARAKGSYVTFEPGARTKWHTHPLGQTLIITTGSGRVQSWGGAVETVDVGDVVWFKPGEKHWHG